VNSCTFMPDLAKLHALLEELRPYHAKLVAVSKTRTAEEVRQVYDAGHTIFGENYVQELVLKKEQLPADSEWHFIGHLQTNKIRMIAPFIALIHGADSYNVLEQANKEGKKAGKVIECLLQIYIAEEETKFGLDFGEAQLLLERMHNENLQHVKVTGLMGLATNTDDHACIEKEFRSLFKFYTWMKEQYDLSVLSMGMTGDYKIALECGSNMVRIGSAIFGERPSK
jgi:PLP dependent protein